MVLDLGLQEGDIVLGLLAGGLELADGLALVVELEGLLLYCRLSCSERL